MGTFYTASECKLILDRPLSSNFVTAQPLISMDSRGHFDMLFVWHTIIPPASDGGLGIVDTLGFATRPLTSQ